MNRASVLAPPVGWLCHGCGYSTDEKPERCPKCSGSVFERTGPAEAVRESQRKAEQLGGPKIRRSLVAHLECVDGCGAFVSRKGVRCRTCAGVLRRKKGSARTRPAKTPPGVRVVTGGAPVASTAPPSPVKGLLVATPTIVEALKTAGFSVKEVHVAEATLLVRLTA